jgi:predicted nucleic acid-binding protein
LIVDAGVLYSAADARDPDHRRAAETLERWQGELVAPAFTIAEADHLILTRLGVDVELQFLESLATEFTVAVPDAEGLRAAAEVCKRYRDLELGLADASIVVLAARFRTRHLASFDEPHFRAVSPLNGGTFELLPADRIER